MKNDNTNNKDAVLTHSDDSSATSELSNDLFDVEELNTKEDNKDEFFRLKPEDWYISSVKSHKIFDHESTMNLIKETLNGNLEARNTLMINNQRLVLSIANRYKYVLQETGAMELKDLVQEGLFGFYKAITKFDINLNTKLSTYATWWIRQTIARAIVDYKLTMRLPSHIHEQLRKYRKITSKLEVKLGRLPDIDELAEEMNLNYEQVFLLDEINYWQYLSLDKPAFEGLDEDGENLSDLIADAGIVLPHITMDQKRLREKLLARLKVNLTEREYQIIDWRFGLTDNTPRVLRIIGESFLLTRERIRQIQEVALIRLKSDPVIRRLTEECLDKKFPKVPWPQITMEDGKLKSNLDNISWYDVNIQSSPADGFSKKKTSSVKAIKRDSLVVDVVKSIEKFYNLRENIIYEESKELDVLLAQRVTIYILWHHYKCSLNFLSSNLNQKDHGRIMTACNRVKNTLTKDEKLQNAVLEILLEVQKTTKNIGL